MPRRTTETMPSQKELEGEVHRLLLNAETALTNAEIERAVCDALRLSEELRSQRHGNTARTEIDYRLAWARTALHKQGKIERSGHAKWGISTKVVLTT